MQIKNLTSSAKLPSDSLCYNAVVMFKHIGLNGVSVLRCVIERAHISYSAHSHIERSRDRRCREGENIDIFADFLESLFLCNAETLFLVDNDKTEVTESDVFLDYSVSADYHINLASCKAFDNIRLMLWRAEAA